MKVIANKSKLGRSDWLALRKKGVFSTDCPVILGLSPWKTPLELYLEKTGQDEEPPDNPYFRDGRMLEDDLAQLYREESGQAIEPFDEVGIHPNYPFIGANFDYRNEFGEPVELKTTGERGWRDWDDGVPLQYQAQLMHQLAICGARRGHIIVWSYGKGTQIFSMERNEQLISTILERCSDFWLEHVEKKVAPQADADPRSLAKLFAEASGEIDLGEDADTWAAQYLKCKEEEKKYKEQADFAKAELMKLVGSHERGHTKRYSISWPVITSYRLDTEAILENEPLIKGKYTVVTRSRRFGCKEIKSLGSKN